MLRQVLPGATSSQKHEPQQLKWGIGVRHAVRAMAPVGRDELRRHQSRDLVASNQFATNQHLVQALQVCIVPMKQHASWAGATRHD